MKSTAKRCGHCNMRWSRCLCKKQTSSTDERVTPRLEKDVSQGTLPIAEHTGSRVAYWMRWMRTEGIREGWTVQPEQNQSSQDQRRAYHGVKSYKAVSERPKTVTDGSAAPARTIGGAEQPPSSGRGSGRTGEDSEGAQTS